MVVIRANACLGGSVQSLGFGCWGPGLSVRGMGVGHLGRMGFRVQGLGVGVGHQGASVGGLGTRWSHCPGSARSGHTCWHRTLKPSAVSLCKVTPVILHGVVSPDILHGVVSPESRARPRTQNMHPQLETLEHKHETASVNGAFWTRPYDLALTVLRRCTVHGMSHKH